MADTPPSDFTTLTVDLLSAYLSSNHIESGELAGLIRTTHDALQALNASEEEVAAPVEHIPAVGVRKSRSSPDHLLSLIDGKPYKTLKRHLASHGLTPADYRARYKLSDDYPMVAPSYSETRRVVAARLGLGRQVKAPAALAADAPEAVTAAASTKPRKPRATKPKADAAPSPAAPAESPKKPKRAPLRLKLAGDVAKVD